MNRFVVKYLKIFRKGLASPKRTFLLIFGALRVAGVTAQGTFGNYFVCRQHIRLVSGFATVSNLVLCFVGRCSMSDRKLDAVRNDI